MAIRAVSQIHICILLRENIASIPEPSFLPINFQPIMLPLPSSFSDFHLAMMFGGSDGAGWRRCRRCLLLHVGNPRFRKFVCGCHVDYVASASTYL
ncbi:hypothetical protein QVD17_37584 [Tagetes erecta]|uniref:Uncharacterized protein n=1 Tax=Tagetes erecta TaxID=13708 RepID=A0AAD8K0S9_TARER|nr:hypothetical protein QVD17_37584 [Tagetes erecta]